MRAIALLLPLVALLTPAPAQASNTEFGESFWIEGTLGTLRPIGVERADWMIVVRGNLGFRLDDEWGLELSAERAGALFTSMVTTNVGVAAVYLPAESMRLRLGARSRTLEIGPAGEIFTADASTGMASSDLGVELGVLSQWTAGAFFFAVEWLSLYQPVVAVDAEYVYYQGEEETGREAAGWSGIELPAEFRYLNLSVGLTF